MKEQFHIPIIGEGMKHETEINYVKNKIAKLEMDFAGFAALLIQAGIVVVDEVEGQQVFKVNKVKLDEQPEIQQD